MNLLVARAPLRLSLAGGGTDLPEWYRGRGARLLAVAIDQVIEVRQTTSRDAEESAAVRLARRLCPALGPVTVRADVPAGSGLGGSGALATALVALTAHLGGETLSPAETGLRAYAWERDLLRHPAGFQDSLCSAVGGCVEMTAAPGGEVTAQRRPDLEDCLDDLLSGPLVLAASGVRRDSAPLLHRLASTLGARTPGTVDGVATVDEVTAAVVARDGAAFGEILRRHWTAKLRLSPGASWPAADSALDAAMAAGATGGKVVGAGGGGFVLCAGPASAAARMRAALTASGFTPVNVRVARQGVRVEANSDTSGDDRTTTR